MGTASTTKLIKNSAGQLAEETTLTTSAGAADANKVPALNAQGVLDATIVNSKNTSAGVGDAGKIPALNASGILDDSILNATVTSAASKIVKLGADGKLDATVMPTGIGADTAAITASEALAAGDLVNIWNDAGTAKVRKADGSTAGKQADGFVLVGVAMSAVATVYFEGTNTQCTGLTPGGQFLSASTPGKSVTAAPSASGNIVQKVGVATSATALNFDRGEPITLA